MRLFGFAANSHVLLAIDQQGQSLPNNGMVIDDKYFYFALSWGKRHLSFCCHFPTPAILPFQTGNEQKTVVPPYAPAPTWNVPPIKLARCRMICSPIPA